MTLIPNSILRLFRPMNYYRFIQWRFKILQVIVYSRRLNRYLSDSGKRGLFLDCGSNIGQGFEFFRKFYSVELYDYILFEPNPYCYQLLQEKYSRLSVDGVQIKNVAIGTYNGKVDFYGLEEAKGGVYSVGGTVLSEHNSKMYTDPNVPSLQVQSINFTEFLADLFEKKKYSASILKLDIEGGEYSVLDSLSSSNLLSKFETVYVEFHSQYMSSEYYAQYKEKEGEFFRSSKRIGTRVIRWI
jgi:FkbM family methyltransferase